MRKTIRQVDNEKRIVQVTTVDERWYIKENTDKKTGLPILEYVPSVTWITDHYPKGTAFYKWLANKGWDEAEALKIAAGDKGSKVHFAICDLIDGKEVKIDSKYMNPTTEEMEELTLEEYECILSFVDWVNEVKPKIHHRELTVFNNEFGYAGTIDLICGINDKIYIIDFKTSQNIWPSHELQVSAYKHAYREKIDKLAILQLGYKKKKKRYKFTEVDDQFDLFLAAKQIWEKETKGVQPKQKDYPLSIKL